jgi:hypothetical protein
MWAVRQAKQSKMAAHILLLFILSVNSIWIG